MDSNAESLPLSPEILYNDLWYFSYLKDLFNVFFTIFALWNGVIFFLVSRFSVMVIVEEIGVGFFLPG